jgi:hypothetical protein
MDIFTTNFDEQRKMNDERDAPLALFPLASVVAYFSLSLAIVVSLRV